MDPYIGEIKMWSFDWAPVNWAFCDGAVLPITQNQALYTLVGTYYDANTKAVPGVSFALPDLRGRVPLSSGAPKAGYDLGTTGGAEAVALTAATMPAHTHLFMAASSANSALPTDALIGEPAPPNLAYGAAKSLVSLTPTSVTSVGGGAGHDTMQPYGVVNFCIAMTGFYPSRS